MRPWYYQRDFAGAQPLGGFTAQAISQNEGIINILFPDGIDMSLQLPL
jgi:hypothetical protein